MIKFRINFLSLIKLFFYVTKKSRQQFFFFFERWESDFNEAVMKQH